MWGLKSKYTATQVFHRPSQVRHSEKAAIFFIILRTGEKKVLNSKQQGNMGGHHLYNYLVYIHSPFKLLNFILELSIPFKKKKKKTSLM